MFIEWSDTAVGDVKAILRYLKKTGMAYLATKTRDEIEEATKKLETFPNIGRVGSDVDTKEIVMRDMPYIIVYRISNNVEILRVIHTSRYWHNPEK